MNVGETGETFDHPLLNRDADVRRACFPLEGDVHLDGEATLLARDLHPVVPPDERVHSPDLARGIGRVPREHLRSDERRALHTVILRSAGSFGLKPDVRSAPLRKRRENVPDADPSRLGRGEAVHLEQPVLTAFPQGEPGRGRLSRR